MGYREMAEKKEVIYTGFFVEREELERILQTEGLPQRLQIPIEYPHVTLAFKPAEAHEELYGTRAVLEAFAYGNDGRNEGLAVRVETGEPVLAALVGEVAVPHITLSVADGAQAVDTADLDFEPIRPFRIKGTFGGFYADSFGDTEIRKEQPR